MLLEGKVAIVAGAGMGLGRVTARALAVRGASEVVAARRRDRVEAMAKDLSTVGADIRAIAADVTSREDCDRVASMAVEAFGGIDIVVANAGHPGTEGPLLGLSDAELRRPLETNLFGSLNVVRAALPALRSGGCNGGRGGCVILVGSLVGLRVVDHFGAYAVSKAALLHAGRYLARELGPLNIRVNSVLPGSIAGRAIDRYHQNLADRGDVTIEEVRAAAVSDASLRRLPTAEEVANTIVYLASDLSASVTGQGLAVSCGQWDAFAEPHLS